MRVLFSCTRGIGQLAPLRTFLDGLADEPLNLVVTVGPNNDPADLGPAPPNAIVGRYIPQTALFPRCQLGVAQAPASTPSGPDRSTRSSPNPVLTPAIARASSLAVLNDRSYRQRAESLRTEIASLPGPERAVPLLERLASDSRSKA